MSEYCRGFCTISFVYFADFRILLILRFDVGQSRGFAFVEFHSVLEAQTWMESVRVRNVVVLLNFSSMKSFQSDFVERVALFSV